MSAPIVVVGSVNADLRITVHRHPQPGETVLGDDGTVTPGGKGANQALAATRAGGHVAMVGAVGQDPDAHTALHLLKDSGTDLSAVEEVDAPTGIAVVMVADSAENEIIVIPGANATVTAETIDRHRDLIAEATAVVCQGETPAQGITRVHQICQTRGTRFILNPAPVITLPPEVIRAADPLIVNEHEAALVAAMIDDGADTAALEADPPTCIRLLASLGCGSVVMTLGSRGALVARQGKVQAIQAVKVEAVDTVGAGDAFVGALAARLADGQGLEQACRYATRFAALTVTREGAQSSYPTADEAAAI